MLESLSTRLMEVGGAHHDCPDKEPLARLATLDAAGRAQVPFTTGEDSPVSKSVALGRMGHNVLTAVAALISHHIFPHITLKAS